MLALPQLKALLKEHNLYRCYININIKKLWFIHELTAHYTSKTAKNTHQHIA